MSYLSLLHTLLKLVYLHLTSTDDILASLLQCLFHPIGLLRHALPLCSSSLSAKNVNIGLSTNVSPNLGSRPDGGLCIAWPHSESAFQQYTVLQLLINAYSSERQDDAREQHEAVSVQPRLAAEPAGGAGRQLAARRRLALRHVQAAARRRQLGHHRDLEARGTQEQMREVTTQQFLSRVERCCGFSALNPDPETDFQPFGKSLSRLGWKSTICILSRYSACIGRSK